MLPFQRRSGHQMPAAPVSALNRRRFVSQQRVAVIRHLASYYWTGDGRSSCSRPFRSHDTSRSQLLIDSISTQNDFAARVSIRFHFEFVVGVSLCLRMVLRSEWNSPSYVKVIISGWKGSSELGSRARTARCSQRLGTDAASNLPGNRVDLGRK